MLYGSKPKLTTPRTNSLIPRTLILHILDKPPVSGDGYPKHFLRVGDAFGSKGLFLIISRRFRSVTLGSDRV